MKAKPWDSHLHGLFDRHNDIMQLFCVGTYQIHCSCKLDTQKIPSDQLEEDIVACNQRRKCILDPSFLSS